MATTSVDPAVQLVLDNMQIIVGSESGSLEVVDVSDGRFAVKYNEGRNDECPECVPTHDMVHEMMTASLGNYQECYPWPLRPHGLGRPFQRAH